MLYVDIPTRSEFATLSSARADACVSIYLKSHLTRAKWMTKIGYRRILEQAVGQN